MARRSNLQPLTLEGSNFADGQSQAQSQAQGQGQERSFTSDNLQQRSPLSPKSPISPRSPFFFSTKKFQGGEASMQGPEPHHSQHAADLPQSQTVPSLSQYSAAEENNTSRERERPARTGFFSNYKASKSTTRFQSSADAARPGTQDSMSRDAEQRPAMAGRVSSKESTRNRVDPEPDRSTTRRPVGGPTKSQSTNALVSSQEPSSNNTNTYPNTNTLTKKNKPKPFSILGRTKSIRGDEQSPRDPSPNNRIPEPEKAYVHNNPTKTAPLRSDNDRSFRDMMASNVRQHSADRQPTNGKDIPGSRENKQPTSLSSSFRESGGHTFLNNLKSSASKGAGALSKGLFGKGGRSGSTNEKEQPVDDEQYQLKVINLPLVQQTRLTRISKRLEDSKDKTEFWMPAFPWRAIDYLNYKGSDVEGLYRVPGSGPQIKKWQRRFDEEHDIDLFEQDDLYDINIIGSMLKAWLRELPDELFPKEAQDRVARHCSTTADSSTVPQQLIDELSALSPFNYYLLFAITCHLSLLLAHSEKNKMDFRNLCICFQPCMKIDAFSFKFLVCDWRDCWKGCKTEQEYIRAEYDYFHRPDLHPPASAEGRSSTAVESEHEAERNVSSSDSSKPSSVSINPNQNSSSNENKWPPLQNNGAKKLPSFGQSRADMGAGAGNTTLTVVQERTPPRSTEMRPLSPIKPLSPIGL